MTENKSSNFFTWILPTLRKCNVIKQNHLQMVKRAVQPSAIKAMMCLLNKVCFSKPYETLSLAIDLVAPSKDWKHFWTSKEVSDANGSKSITYFNALCLHEHVSVCWRDRSAFMKRDGAQNELESFHLGHLSTDAHSLLDFKLRLISVLLRTLTLTFLYVTFSSRAKKADVKDVLVLSLTIVWKYGDDKH